VLSPHRPCQRQPPTHGFTAPGDPAGRGREGPGIQGQERQTTRFCDYAHFSRRKGEGGPSVSLSAPRSMRFRRGSEKAGAVHRSSRRASIQDVVYGALHVPSVLRLGRPDGAESARDIARSGLTGPGVTALLPLTSPSTLASRPTTDPLRIRKLPSCFPLFQGQPPSSSVMSHLGGRHLRFYCTLIPYVPSVVPSAWRRRATALLTSRCATTSRRRESAYSNAATSGTARSRSG
jgi:hypothetical protein